MTDQEQSGVWRCRDLGDALMAHLDLSRLEADARAVWDGQHAPGFAVLTRHSSEGRLHCAVLAYFSPAAAGLAARFDATPCRRPAREGLALLAGDEHVLEAL